MAYDNKRLRILVLADFFFPDSVGGANKMAFFTSSGLSVSGNDVTVVTMSARKPQLFFVPAGYYNGAMSLTDNTKILVYSTLTFPEVKNDNERACWSLHKDVWEVENR